MARKGLTKPVGSMTQYDKIRIGKGDAKKYLKYDEIVPLASLNDIVFGCWDVYPQNAFQAAMYAEVLKEKDILPVRDELEKIALEGISYFKGESLYEYVEESQEYLAVKFYEESNHAKSSEYFYLASRTRQKIKERESLK